MFLPSPGSGSVLTGARSCACCSAFPLSPALVCGSVAFRRPQPSLPDLIVPIFPRERGAGEQELGGSAGAGSQSVCKRHCFDTEAYGAIRNSKKKPRSRCCQGRKLAANSQACKMPVLSARSCQGWLRASHRLSGLTDGEG